MQDSIAWLIILVIVLLFLTSRKNRKESPMPVQPEDSTIIQTSIQKDIGCVATPVKNGYIYHKRHCLMTQTEKELFLRLVNMYGNKYFVLPQVHLSSLLDHKVRNGQYWKGALSSINQKSVDFVFCSYPDVEPILALEYDDWRHEYHENVKEKDDVKDELFARVGLPLARIRVRDHLSDDEIKQRLSDFIQ